MQINNSTVSFNPPASSRALTKDETASSTNNGLADLKRLGLSIDKDGVVNLPSNAEFSRNGMANDVSFVRITVDGKSALFPEQLLKDNNIRIRGGQTDDFGAGAVKSSPSRTPIPPEHFNAELYMRSNPDVMKAWQGGAIAPWNSPGKSMDQAAKDHYSQFGKNENRQILASPREYLALNPDVAAWANGLMARKAQDPGLRLPGAPEAQNVEDLAKFHSLAFGQPEGRPAVADVDDSGSSLVVDSRSATFVIQANEWVVQNESPEGLEELGLAEQMLKTAQGPDGVVGVTLRGHSSAPNWQEKPEPHFELSFVRDGKPEQGAFKFDNGRFVQVSKPADGKAAITLSLPGAGEAQVEAQVPSEDERAINAERDAAREAEKNAKTEETRNRTKNRGVTSRTELSLEDDGF